MLLQSKLRNDHFHRQYRTVGQEPIRFPMAQALLAGHARQQLVDELEDGHSEVVQVHRDSSRRFRLSTLWIGPLVTLVTSNLLDGLVRCRLMGEDPLPLSNSADKTTLLGGRINSNTIAEIAGVSQSTVSRVLNDNPNVSEQKRQRVLEVIRRLGYTPNTLARTLVTQKSLTVGLIVSNISNQFYPEFVDATGSLLGERGLSMILCNTQQAPDRQHEYIQILLQQRVAGIIVTSTVMHAPYIQEVLESGFPIVLVNRSLEGIRGDTVVIDNFAGAVTAVNHLLRLGHRRIAYVQGRTDTTTNRDREQGYRDALAKAGLPLDPQLILPGDYTWATAYQAGAKFLAIPNRPTAALCADDETAFGFIDALYDGGLAVPQDCAVIGFDDVRAAAYRPIGLTTVRQPIRLMAEQATRLLLERIERSYRGEPRQLTYPAELVIRRTCGANPGWGMTVRREMK